LSPNSRATLLSQSRKSSRVRDRLLAEGKIDASDLGLVRVSDSVEDTCRYLLEAYQDESWRALPGQAGAAGSGAAGYP
jgi:hypothetical protein